MAESDNNTSDNSGEPEFAFDLKTKLNGPISELSLMEQSLLFAELSSICYYNEANVTPLVSQLGFTRSEYHERDGAQAYIFGGETDTIVACRGTEPNEWNDIRADANATSALAETVGKVHSGFKQEVDDLWPELEEALVSNENTLWFTGHSLGGAMATISAGRCFLSHIESMPAGLFTYGSPRVGDKRYVNYCELNHIRWVNNNDIVTRVPPAWLGFRHSGREMYLDAKGRVRDITGWGRVKDRMRGFLRGLRRFKVDHFSDHVIDNYIDYIHVALEKERAEPSRRDTGVSSN
jgi:triacylglycerol lipase